MMKIRSPDNVAISARVLFSRRCRAPVYYYATPFTDQYLPSSHRSTPVNPVWRGIVVSLDAEIRAGGVRRESAFIKLQPKIPVETKAIAPTDNACFTPLDK
jgi:hypothetical protein